MKGRVLRAAREKLFIISRERVGNKEEYQGIVITITTTTRKKNDIDYY